MTLAWSGIGFNKSPALPMAWSWRGNMANVSSKTPPGMGRIRGSKGGSTRPTDKGRRLHCCRLTVILYLATGAIRSITITITIMITMGEGIGTGCRISKWNSMDSMDSRIAG